MAQMNQVSSAGADDQAEQLALAQRRKEAQQQRIQQELLQREQKWLKKLRQARLLQRRAQLAYWGDLVEKLFTYLLFGFIAYMVTRLPWGALYSWLMR